MSENNKGRASELRRGFENLNKNESQTNNKNSVQRRSRIPVLIKGKPKVSGTLNTGVTGNVSNIIEKPVINKPVIKKPVTSKPVVNKSVTKASQIPVVNGATIKEPVITFQRNTIVGNIMQKKPTPDKTISQYQIESGSAVRSKTFAEKIGLKNAVPNETNQNQTSDRNAQNEVDSVIIERKDLIQKAQKISVNIIKPNLQASAVIVDFDRNSGKIYLVTNEHVTKRDEDPLWTSFQFYDQEITIIKERMRYIEDAKNDLALIEIDLKGINFDFDNIEKAVFETKRPQVGEKSMLVGNMLAAGSKDKKPYGVRGEATVARSEDGRLVDSGGRQVIVVVFIHQSADGKYKSDDGREIVKIGNDFYYDKTNDKIYRKDIVIQDKNNGFTDYKGNTLDIKQKGNAKYMNFLITDNNGKKWIVERRVIDKDSLQPWTDSLFSNRVYIDLDHPDPFIEFDENDMKNIIDVENSKINKENAKSDDNEYRKRISYLPSFEKDGKRIHVGLSSDHSTSATFGEIINSGKLYEETYLPYAEALFKSKYNDLRNEWIFNNRNLLMILVFRNGSEVDFYAEFDKLHGPDVRNFLQDFINKLGEDWKARYQNSVESTAFAYQGNSGGALLNDDGNVTGVEWSVPGKRLGSVSVLASFVVDLTNAARTQGWDINIQTTDTERTIKSEISDSEVNHRQNEAKKICERQTKLGLIKGDINTGSDFGNVR